MRRCFLILIAFYFWPDFVKAETKPFRSVTPNTAILSTEVYTVGVTSIPIGDTQGVLVFYDSASHPLQGFSPADLIGSAAKAIFFRFDSEAGRYSSLVVGEAEFPIVGDVFLRLGAVDVSLSSTTSYLSIIHEGLSEDQLAGIGIFQNQFVAMYTGSRAAAYFDPAQLPAGEEFVVRRDGDKLLLTLRDRVFAGKVGIAPQEVDHSCLRNTGAIVSESEYQRLDQGELTYDESSVGSSLDDFVILTYNKGSIVALNSMGAPVVIDTAEKRPDICVHRLLTQ